MSTGLYTLLCLFSPLVAYTPETVKALSAQCRKEKLNPSWGSFALSLSGAEVCKPALPRCSKGAGLQPKRCRLDRTGACEAGTGLWPAFGVWPPGRRSGAGTAMHCAALTTNRPWPRCQDLFSQLQPHSPDLLARGRGFSFSICKRGLKATSFLHYSRREVCVCALIGQTQELVKKEYRNPKPHNALVWEGMRWKSTLHEVKSPSAARERGREDERGVPPCVTVPV